MWTWRVFAETVTYYKCHFEYQYTQQVIFIRIKSKIINFPCIKIKICLIWWTTKLYSHVPFIVYSISYIFPAYWYCSYVVVKETSVGNAMYSWPGWSMKKVQLLNPRKSTRLDSIQMCQLYKNLCSYDLDYTNLHYLKPCLSKCYAAFRNPNYIIKYNTCVDYASIILGIIGMLKHWA